MFLRAFGQPLLVLNSQKRINDLLDKRSLIYSGRPYSTMMIELLDWGHMLGLMESSNPWWKRQRKFFHQTYTASVIPEYQPIIRRHIHRLLGDLLSTPGDQYGHSALGGILLNIAYGFDPKSKDDPYIAEALKVTYAFQVAVLPGAFLVDHIPLLKYVPAWMPGARFKRWAEYYRKTTYNAQNRPFDFSMDGMRRNEVQSCALTKVVESLPDPDDPTYAEVKDNLLSFLGVSYFAGVDSTNGLLSKFIMAMATYPEIQEKAQAELDRVIGTDRLPDFGDREDLIYLKALIIETMRWHQVLPLGLPQKLMEDDYYDGYFIPKGTIVIGNAWAVLHDPNLFENPMEFIPERYIKNGRFNNDLVNPLDFDFGFGRRVCPGKDLAMEILYLAISSLLSVFEISPPKDATGTPIKIKPSFIGGALAYVLNSPAIRSRTQASVKCDRTNRP
ncbi:hypothetical protein EST38_g9453 [Candolleomyces aberdarensis]|uniref:O-methylsterigmatocystin oxidoreductase n=1 Tax=Candolleomyces aberdarensis TaxID=2316362 RepID=A0A4Q2DBL9_9AGAR|nr:hypothetical protein EST38_g9453 [Candolleomyces aberdarensis]